MLVELRRVVGDATPAEPRRCAASAQSGLGWAARRRRGGRRFSPWPHSVAQRRAVNARSRAAASRRCVNCNAVCANDDERADRFVLGCEAERPPWGRRTFGEGGACRLLR